MANNLYTTKTASLKATKADVGKLNTNKFNSSEIRLRGQNIEELLKLSPKELVFRCELPEDKPWSLWTDDGNLLYFNKSEEIVNGSHFFSSRSIVSFDSDLSSLTNGTYMFQYCTNLTSFSSDLPNLTNGMYMFYKCDNLTTFASDLSSLTNGLCMFCWCRKLTSFNSDLSNLTDGRNMFKKTCLDFTSIKHIITCLQTTNILSTAHGEIDLGIDVSERLNPELMAMFGIDNNTNTDDYSKTIKTKNGGTWTVIINWGIKDEDVDIDLSSLQNGTSLLEQCDLETFGGNLSGLTNGTDMFYKCTNLTTFTSDLPNLTDGSSMFYGCSKLESFDTDLSSLTDGGAMFYQCSNLTSFSSDLSSLTNGSAMFYGCKLNKESVINIITCLKERNTCSVNASLTLSIDGSLINDAEILELLGIAEGDTSTTIVGHGGGTWDITLRWL